MKTRTKPALPTLLLLLLVAANHQPPEDAARQWAKDLGLTVQGVSCTQVDTDNDGYVSCTLALDKADNDGNKLIGLQCAAVQADDCTARSTKGCKLDQAKAAPPKSQ